jgi:hypothetical protein
MEAGEGDVCRHLRAGERQGLGLAGYSKLGRSYGKLGRLFSGLHTVRE